ncbi:MAG: hypothetical protein ABW170_08620 [Candidatus Thiodiazotropha sp. L084R]
MSQKASRDRRLACFIFFEFYTVRKIQAIESNEIFSLLNWFSLPTYKELSNYLKVSISITSAIFLASVNTSLPRIVSLIIFDPLSVGLLAGFVQIGNVFVPLLNGITQAAMPRLGRCFQFGKIDEFKKSAILLVIVSFTSACIVLLVSQSSLSDDFVKLILNETFASYNQYFTLVAASSFFAYFNAVMGPVKIAQLQYTSELIQNLVVFILLIICCFGLGNIFGLEGIFYSIIIAQAFRTFWLGFTILSGIKNNS